MKDVTLNQREQTRLQVLTWRKWLISNLVLTFSLRCPSSVGRPWAKKKGSPFKATPRDWDVLARLKTVSGGIS